MKRLLASILISSLSLLVLLNCNRRSDYDPERYSFKDITTNQDTAKAVSYSNFFFTCFGLFKSESEFLDRFKDEYRIEREIVFPFRDSSMVTTLYKVIKDDSYIKYVVDDNSAGLGMMNIVSARISNDKFTMANGLKVGMSKREVLRMIFGQNINRDFKQARTIQITTALAGLWINLDFIDDKLFKIYIYSDYILDQD